MTQTVKFDIDKDFKRIGEFGPYQILIFVLVGLTACIPALIVHGYAFISGTPQHRCQIPSLDNDTYELTSGYHESMVNQYIPIQSTNPIVYDKCHIKVYANESDNQNWNTSSSQFTLQKCNSWVFSDKVFKKTIVTDWKLVCDDAAKKSTFSSVYFFGTYGVIFVGLLSDKFGRKTCAYVLVVFNLIFTALTAVILNVNINTAGKEIGYMALRTLIGTSGNTYSIAVVLAIEVCGPTYRVAASNTIYYFYILGEYAAVLLCYLVRDYDRLYIWLTGILCIFPLYFWAVPESPRWLIAKNRDNEAYILFKKIARSNRKPLPDTYNEFILKKTKEIKDEQSIYGNSEDQVAEAEIEKLGFLQTLYTFVKSKRLLLRTIAVAFNW